MATNAQLQEQIRKLEEAMARAGIRLPGAAPRRPEERADYIAFGSPEHMAFLGLIEVQEGDDASDYVTVASRDTGKVYRLEDELGVAQRNPNLDPEKVARLVLRQKIAVFEAGPVKVPEDAPPLFNPEGAPGEWQARTVSV